MSWSKASARHGSVAWSPGRQPRCRRISRAGARQLPSSLTLFCSCVLSSGKGQSHCIGPQMSLWVNKSLFATDQAIRQVAIFTRPHLIGATQCIWGACAPFQHAACSDRACHPAVQAVGDATCSLQRHPPKLHRSRVRGDAQASGGATQANGSRTTQKRCNKSLGREASASLWRNGPETLPA
eukprot:366124-Chlamydomonas_euryale.AAC.13